MPNTGVSDPILRTKIQIPRVRPQRVERPRLVERMQENSWSRLTLVCAPAGFGKTTFLAAWAQASGSPVAWLTLASAENALEQFFRYLIASLGSVLPGVGERAIAMLQSPQPFQSDSIITSLVNDLEERATPVTLVMDDFHTIDADAVFSAVDMLLNNMPDCLRMVIASRSDPRLSLARLRARGELLELRGKDLRFSSQEAADFLNSVMGLTLTRDQVEALEKRTEGWIAGLQLAALSMRDCDDPERFIRVFTGSHRYILDYLVGEVLQRQPQDIQQFLLRTSILERLNGELCDVLLSDESPPGITGLPTRQPSSEILDTLEQSNLFIQPLDDERHWYRYHTLFADLLGYRLEQMLPGEASILHRKAADWFEKHGYLIESINHLIAAQDWLQAALLAERQGGLLLSQTKINQFHGWFDQLPSVLFQTLPRLHLLYCWGLITAGQFQAVETRLQTAEQALAAFPDDTVFPGEGGPIRTMRAEIASTRAIIASVQGDLKRAIQLGNQALEGLTDDLGMRCSVLIGLGVSYRLSGDTQQAVKTLGEAAASGLRGQQFSVALTALCNQGELLFELGELSRAEECFSKALAIGGTPNQNPINSMAFAGLSDLAYERNDLATARSLIENALELDNVWGNQEIHILNLLRLSRILVASGHIQDGWEALEQAKASEVKTFLTPLTAAGIDTYRIEVWLASGRIDLAREWVQAHPLAVSGSQYLDDPIHLIWATAMADLGAATGDQNMLLVTQSELKKYLPALKEAGRYGYVINVLVLLALTSFASDQKEMAFQYLQEALHLAAPSQYVRIFIQHGQPMKQLLQEYRKTFFDNYPEPDVDTASTHAYIKKLLASYVQPPVEKLPVDQSGTFQLSAVPTQSRKDPILSARESEVLQLVAQGLSNADIAARLVVSPGTVKRHLHNIFEKLDVNTRPQAIALARQLGLV